MMGWRYYWRRYFGWFPIQFCMVCGKTYWGGLPRWGWKEDFFGDGRRIWVQTWAAWMQDYCSRECADEDMEMMAQAHYSMYPEDGLSDAYLEEHEEYDPLDYADNEGRGDE